MVQQGGIIGDKQTLKKDYLKFLSADDTQAFIFAFVGFTVLLVLGQLDLDSYTKIMMVATGAFFGQKITNRV